MCTRKLLPAACLLLLGANLGAQPSSVLIWGDPVDGVAPAWAASRAILQSAAGDLYVLLRKGGTPEGAIYRSTDMGATWSRAGTFLLPASVSAGVFATDGVTLNVVYSNPWGTYNQVVFNTFDTVTDTWNQPADTILFTNPSHQWHCCEIARTGDDKLLVVAQTYGASPSQGIYYRFFNGTSWDPDPATSAYGVKLDLTYTSGIYADILLDPTAPAATSEAIILYRSATGSYGRIETKLHLGSFSIGPEIGLSGQSGGFLAGTSEDRTSNLQSAIRLPSGDIYMAFNANNSANSNPRVRMGHRDPAGTWTFHDVFAGAGYNHGNVSFYDIQMGIVDGEIAVYYGKNSYSGSTTAQAAPGLFRKIWDPVTLSFGPEVSLNLVNQNGTFGLLCTPEEELPGFKEFFVYRDNTTDMDVYAYRDVAGMFVRTVSSTETTVFLGQTGIIVDVSIENMGGNTLDNLTASLRFTDAGLVDRTADYVVTPDPGNPISIGGTSTEVLSFTVEVLPGATLGTITLDASADADDMSAGTHLNDPEADTTHAWDVIPCATTLCGDCNGDGQVTILDALAGAQHSAGLVTLQGSEFSNCNVTGLVEPDPLAAVTILDALAIAQSAAGLPVTLACC